VEEETEEEIEGEDWKRVGQKKEWEAEVEDKPEKEKEQKTEQDISVFNIVFHVV